VGTKAQLDFLQARGCHCFQGFWISKPLPTPEFATFVNTMAVKPR
jgi:EAL domain-containing protein (putative c-di-GMP-specific phosphodiesterase class I)